MRALNMGRLSIAIVIAGFFLPASGVHAQQKSPYEQMDGYEEATLASREATIDTREGPKDVTLSEKKIRVEGGAGRAEIALPERGFVLIQHRAGEAEIQMNGKTLTPLEGEWLALDLPAQLVIQTEDDAVLMDVFVIEE